MNVVYEGLIQQSPGQWAKRFELTGTLEEFKTLYRWADAGSELKAQLRPIMEAQRAITGLENPRHSRLEDIHDKAKDLKIPELLNMTREMLRRSEKTTRSGIRSMTVCVEISQGLYLAFLSYGSTSYGDWEGHEWMKGFVEKLEAAVKAGVAEEPSNENRIA